MSTLQTTLKQLRLSGLLQTLDVRLQEALANRLEPRRVPGTDLPGRN
jgi:hypothetical protein